MPIWQLLGGAFRDRVRLYNDCHAGDEDNPAYLIKQDDGDEVLKRGSELSAQD